MIKYAIAIAAFLQIAVAVPPAVAGEQEWAAQALAVTPDPEHGKVLFLKRCAACHGRHAWGDGLREIPTLAGQRENYLIEQLERFAKGQREGSKMHGPVMRESLTPPDVNRVQAIRDLTSYLARAARNPEPEEGQAKTPSLGKQIYEKTCTRCHGEEGGGNDEQRVPAIGGQHYSYVAARLEDVANGHVNHPLTPELAINERQAVADYTSRLSYLRAQDAP
jgi:cytochrome c553